MGSGYSTELLLSTTVRHYWAHARVPEIWNWGMGVLTDCIAVLGSLVVCYWRVQQRCACGYWLCVASGPSFPFCRSGSLGAAKAALHATAGGLISVACMGWTDDRRGDDGGQTMKACNTWTLCNCLSSFPTNLHTCPLISFNVQKIGSLLKYLFTLLIVDCNLQPDSGNQPPGGGLNVDFGAPQ